MTLWEGRLEEPMDPEAWRMNASLAFDRRLGDQDVRGSQAWAEALRKAGLLTEGEAQSIQSGLTRIRQELADGVFAFQPDDEDIHSAVERRLVELVGPVGGKVHTGRSRNDQVASDFRLWILDQRPLLDEALVEMQRALIERAEVDMGLITAGYTHLQRAQPVLLSHWWLGHFWPLQRDRSRLWDLVKRLAVLPLGSGALAGTAFSIDRSALASELGFSRPSANSLDAVSDRDFVVEFLFILSLAGVHLSRLAEAIVLFSSTEFGFFTLADRYATGSSLMPQKKNPDVFELARGQAGAQVGALAGLMATLKGLPTAYDKDLQGDKVPVFNAYDGLMQTLPVLAGAIRSLTVQPDRLAASLEPGLMATDLADYLVLKGVPFREAHREVARAVQEASRQGVTLPDLPLKTFQAIDPRFDESLFAYLDPEHSVSRREVLGGTGPQAVQAQIRAAREAINSERGYAA